MSDASPEIKEQNGSATWSRWSPLHWRKNVFDQEPATHEKISREIYGDPLREKRAENPGIDALFMKCRDDARTKSRP